MPKEHKKRGRRADQKKRKLEQDDDEQSTKRTKHHDADEAADYVALEEEGQGEGFQQDEYMEEADTRVPGQPGDMPFYGMLDEEEQQYFKQADDMLELNEFADPEDRSTFLASVYKEAEGKELKLANSQSCSRLMERLIMLSTLEQLKNLFQEFSEQ